MYFNCKIFSLNRLVGGKGEAYANIAEGLATAIQCFEDLQLKRDGSAIIQKHCILVCNSPPYQLPVMESPSLSGRTVEHLASFLSEVSFTNLSFYISIYTSIVSEFCCKSDLMLECVLKFCLFHNPP